MGHRNSDHFRFIPFCDVHFLAVYFVRPGIVLLLGKAHGTSIKGILCAIVFHHAPPERIRLVVSFYGCLRHLAVDPRSAATQQQVTQSSLQLLGARLPRTRNLWISRQLASQLFWISLRIYMLGHRLPTVFPRVAIVFVNSSLTVTV